VEEAIMSMTPEEPPKNNAWAAWLLLFGVFFTIICAMLSQMALRTAIQAGRSVPVIRQPLPRQ
jgi:hypothetical protein